MKGSADNRDTDKAALRATVLAARRTLSPADLAAAAAAIRSHALAALIPPPTVALYASTGTEPGTHPLLAAWHEAGVRILLPALRADLALDWSVYAGPDSLVPGPRGTLEPAGPRRDPDALGEAGLVPVPGLAADRRGHRLGRGGGSYDRALRLAHPEARIAVVLHAGEIVDAVPVSGHDADVHAVLSPAGFELVGPVQRPVGGEAM